MQKRRESARKRDKQYMRKRRKRRDGESKTQTGRE